MLVNIYIASLLSIILIKFLLDKFLNNISTNNKESYNNYISSHNSNNDNLMEKIREVTFNTNKIEDLYIINKGMESNLFNISNNISNGFSINKEDISKLLLLFKDSVSNNILDISRIQQNELSKFSDQIANLTESNRSILENMKDSIQQKLSIIQKDNNIELEKMREVVNEKLHETLEKRLGDSFNIVSDRLEKVQRGLGEMQNLSSGVLDLKKILTNVKTRGTWGEIQLENILSQLLSTDQFEKNFAIDKKLGERVDFVIKIPTGEREFIFLPIDSKFPLEDYQRLVNMDDVKLHNEIIKQIESKIKFEAKSIKEKYIKPPITTDFAILFLPTEGLYNEVIRRDGLFESLQNDHRIIIAGPWTLSAILSSLRIGFRSFAIERKTGEVWKLLSEIKTEFFKFGELLDKTHKKLSEASDAIEGAAKRSRKIEKKLTNVEMLSDQIDNQLLINYEE